MPFRSYVMDLSTESVPGTYFAHKHIWLLSKNLVTILLICKTWIIPSLDIILKHNHKFIQSIFIHCFDVAGGQIHDRVNCFFNTVKNYQRLISTF